MVHTMNLALVSPKAFKAMQNLNTIELIECSQCEIRPLLPSLVRMTLLSPMDCIIFSILVGMEVVNNIVMLLLVDYHQLEIDVKKEQELRQKIDNSNQDTAQFYGLQHGVELGFERADATRRVRIVLSELLYIQAQILKQNQLNTLRGGGDASSSNENLVKQSELFDSKIYLEEISDIICIALAELPSLFNIQEVVETLLYVNNGSSIICRVVANMPDCFKEVVTSLISNGVEGTSDGQLRLNALSALCDMSPGQALPTRALCVELLKMPSLMLRLSLKDPQDLIAFLSGLLLGNDQTTRLWFTLFVRSNRKTKNNSLQAVRDELLKQLQNIVVLSLNAQFTDESLVQGTALLRLYCALSCIAGVKFNDKEIHALVLLITSKPSPTSTGIRFVSLGLCVLIACPILITQQSLEATCIEWMRWLTKEEAYFASDSGVAASFGEMLLLMAIHFHSNQVSAVCELVCSTLDMKVPLRQIITNRIRQIFTQEIFTEQVVTAHAVKVRVTPQLNANISGYLPVHCIHQLLKSRAFTKHKVPIKSWIFKQIVTCTTPLHSVLPALIEVYVQSIIWPNMRGAAGEHTHEPLSEEDIMKVFRRSAVGAHLRTKRRTYSLESPGVKAEAANGIAIDSESLEPSSISSQLLLLYYLLLYEDVRLSNMATIVANGRKVKSYSTEFLSELPIKYLLQQAQKNQLDFDGLFSPLLRLLITYFPHLSLVDDWIEEETISAKASTSAISVRSMQIVEAFEDIERSPLKAIKLLRLMLRMLPTDLWPHVELFIQYFKKILDPMVPRLVQELYKNVWIRLNTVLPRRLWVLTINALLPDEPYRTELLTQESILFDPLQVVRCDARVFRCPDALAIVLRILQASLAACKGQLSRHILDKPLSMKTGELHSENEREELKTALVANLESAAVQILLEACLETPEDRQRADGQWALREVRGMVSSYIHQVFISEPALAKLVHFQGYPRELLSVTVRGIPSMHICMDFVHELLRMPEMDKQIFAIDLTSHLSLQYSLPRSLGVAKLCVNILSTLLDILSKDTRIEMFRAVLPCVLRLAEAFPPLLEECTLFLMRLGRIAQSQAALGKSISLSVMSLNPNSRIRAQISHIQCSEELVEEVREAFAKLLEDAILKPRIY